MVEDNQRFHHQIVGTRYQFKGGIQTNLHLLKFLLHLQTYLVFVKNLKSNFIFQRKLISSNYLFTSHYLFICHLSSVMVEHRCCDAANLVSMVTTSPDMLGAAGVKIPPRADS